MKGQHNLEETKTPCITACPEIVIRGAEGLSLNCQECAFGE